MKPTSRNLMRCLIAALAMPGAALFAHPSAEHKVDELEQHIRQEPDNIDLRVLYASQLRKMDRYDDAEKALLTIEVLSPDHPGAILERAQIAYYRNGDVVVAESLAQQLLKRHPRYAPAWDFLGQLQRKLNNNDEAIDSFRRYIALTGEYRVGDFTDLATLLSDRNGPGDKDEAIQVIDQGVAKVGDLAGMHLMASNIEASLGRYEAAARRFDKLAARYRPKPDWSRQKGEVLMKAGRYKEAITAFDSAIAMIKALPDSRKNDPEVTKQIGSLEGLIVAANDRLNQ
jgi:cytochrome c-type biogenesis protein CcmH/NrfG